MLPQLKQNIVRLAKEKGWSVNQLEKNAGLHRNFINNLLYNRSKNPGIESIIKIANVLDVTIDELIGKETKNKLYISEIARRDILCEILDYLAKTIPTKHNSKITLEQLTKTIYEIYNYSLKKDIFDKDFADWTIK